MKAYLLEAQDLLFFRDARPMAAGQGRGHGCRLPLPSTLHGALRSALLYESHFSRGEGPRGQRDKPSDISFQGNTAFQSLRLRGPFLFNKPARRPGQADEDYEKQEGDIFLPVPFDVVWAGNRGIKVLSPLRRAAQAGLKYLPVSPLAQEPNNLQVFWKAPQVAAYLGLTPGADYTLTNAEQLFVAEHRVGIEIEDDRQAAKEGQLYSAAYLRPQLGTTLWFQAEVTDARREDEAGTLDQLRLLLLGGDQRLVRIREAKAIPALEIARPSFTKRNCCRLKWVLLSPAIYIEGWRPGWCCDSRKDIPEAARRPPGLVCLDGIDGNAELVSCCLGTPQLVTGWNLGAQDGSGHAKPTLLAVPAGSVYYFECADPETAERLANLLHLRHRSDRFGEKGYGLGVCGTWEPYEAGFK